MNPAAVDIVLAGLNVNRELRDAIAGDLIEGRARLAGTHGRRYADRWVRRQLVGSVPAFVRFAVAGRARAVLAAALGGALGAMLIVGLLIGASSRLLSAVVADGVIARLTMVMLVADLAFGVAGGYLAARFGRAVPLGAALVFGILGLVVATLTTGQTAAWYHATIQLLLLPATVAGGWLRARELARSST